MKKLMLILLMGILTACQTSHVAPVSKPSSGKKTKIVKKKQTTSTKISPAKTNTPQTHRVQSGENLYRIAERYNRSMAQLMAWNFLTDANQISVGQVLRVSPPPAPNTSTATFTGNTQTLNNMKLVWPVRGQTKKTNNGIIIATQQNSNVVAVENGTVVYVGNEMRGYGNLVLIRHANQIVSAYGYNNSILVKKGQKVGKGSVIAKSGRSDAGESALYFALSQNKRFVNPLQYLPQ